MNNLNVKQMSTKELEAILRNDANHPDEEPDLDLLFPVMDELRRRYKIERPNSKTATQSLQEFRKHYFCEAQNEI